ncbi:MAG: ABC transporter ATP-binding protein [Desulfobacterales bacterium]|nr:MAG: ABC transporter ATP-binding protein [Desulfobacterales bacterium]
MENISVELRHVTKAFGEVHAVRDLTLQVQPGSFLTLLGPSGCGKTTTLRMIGGFERPSAGEIFILGKTIAYESSTQRQTNMVFQDYALFPHKTVGQNIGFGLKMRGVKKAEIGKRVREMLDLINLSDVYDRMPHQLSGGQQQRVALARALILKPPVLLLDEPLGALDAKIRKQLQLELKQLQSELGITFIYVTHDQEEAMTMSDTIGIMNDGRLEQLDTPEKIYGDPQTLFVAKFVGECNIFEGRIRSEHPDIVDFEDNRGQIFKLKKDSLESAPVGKQASLVVRPEDIQVADAARKCVNRIQGRVEEKLYSGSIVRLVVDREGEKIMVDAHKGIAVSPPELIEIGWNPDAGSIIL